MAIDKKLLAWITAALCLAACGDDDGKKPAADGGTPVGSAASGDACNLDELCSEGLVCAAGRCAKGAALRLSVDGAARGCEIVVVDAADATLTNVTFEAPVKGSHVRRAPRTGVSFIASKDESIVGAKIGLFVAGEGEPKIDKTLCVDAKGKVLPKATVTLSR